MENPEAFGRFRTDRELGRGAMGVVYLASDPVLERRVAVKAIQIHPGLSREHVEGLRQRFVNEARSAANLSHPNIVTVYEAGFEDDSLYIAMEFVEGESLEDVIASERVLTYKEVADLLLQIGSGLDHAHEAGVVHRDIKPGNILIDRSGKPKIADFGVARQATSTLTATGTIIGTPAYMSPEQITGHTVTGASDQFSLAVVLYEMLTGRKPFSGDAATTVLYRIVHEAPESLLESRKGLPPAIDGAVMKALAKDPAERYGSCTEFAQAVREVLRAAPLDEATAAAASVERSKPDLSKTRKISADDATSIHARAPSPTPPSATEESDDSLRPWLGPALLAGGALVILVIGAFWLSGGDSIEAPPEEPVLEEPIGEAPAGTEGPGAEEAPVAETYTIESRPAGAQVTLDGRVLEGVTPLSVAIDPAARHTVLLELTARESVSWAFVPEELPESQRTSRRLFFPMREIGAGVAADATSAAAQDVEDGDEQPAEEAGPVVEDLEPTNPVQFRPRDMEQPDLVDAPEPAFPDWARDQGLQSYVILEVLVDKNGRVRDGRPLRPVHPELERLALEAVRSWRLTPATRRGEPIDVFYNLTVRFRTDDENE